MRLMNETEYARHRGVNLKTVQNYIARGQIDFDSFEQCPKRKKLLINVEKADKDLESSLNVAKSLGMKAGLVTKKELGKDSLSKPGASSTKDTPSPPADSNPTRETSLRFLSSKADTETLKARKLELEIAQREGHLLDADEVRKQISKMVGETKEKILNVAAKIAPELVSVRDVIEIENKIIQELTAALENLSRLDL